MAALKRDKNGSPSRRRLFVHIGMHKTGTSSIQYACHRNYDILLHHGYLYPMTGRHPLSFVQHDLIYRALITEEQDNTLFKLDNPVDADLLFNALLQEISLTSGHSVVLSAENLWLLGENEVAEFGRRFAEFEIVPVIFIRRFSDYLESLHLTRIRIEPEYAKNFAGRQDFCKGYGDMDLIKTVADWASISASGKVTVHSYDNREKDSVKSFLDIIGLKSAVLRDHDKRYNESQSVLSEAVRTACGRNGFSEDLARNLASQLSNIRHGEKYSLISNAERNALDEKYQLQVQRLLQSSRVTTTDRTKWIMKREDSPIHLDGAMSILFAIGRALTEKQGG
jgi:hypothetical protein